MSSLSHYGASSMATGSRPRIWAGLGCPFDAALALLDATQETALRGAMRIFTSLGAPAAARDISGAGRLRDAMPAYLSCGTITTGHAA